MLRSRMSSRNAVSFARASKTAMAADNLGERNMLVGKEPRCYARGGWCLTGGRARDEEGLSMRVGEKEKPRTMLVLLAHW